MELVLALVVLELVELTLALAAARAAAAAARAATPPTAAGGDAACASPRLLRLGPQLRDLGRLVDVAEEPRGRALGLGMAEAVAIPALRLVLQP